MYAPAVLWLQALALTAVDAVPVTGTKAPPPSKDSRTRVDETLKKVETAFKDKTTEVNENEAFRKSLGVRVDTLESAHAALVKEAEEIAALAKKQSDDAAKTKDAAAQKTADQLQQLATEMQQQVEKRKEFLEKLKTIRKEADEAKELNQKEVNRLKLELKKALEAYFKTADPAMIAQRYGVPLDKNFSFDMNTEFLKLTGGGDPTLWLSRFGLGAEHTWDERYWFRDGFETKVITLKAISQHEQVTTRDIFDMATTLMRREIPGINASVGRFGLTLNDGHRKNFPEAFKGVYGHPVDAFRPTVINNSTGAYSELNKPEVFRELMDLYTRGEGTKTIKAANGTITYGLPPIGKPVVGNASGNSGWGFVPDTTVIQNFYPLHVNIGTSEIPARKDSPNRDDTAPPHVEGYSSSNAGVHAIIRRPRWNPDGTPLKVQYLNPNYDKILEDNLWRLAGKPGTPTPDQLTDEKEYPPALVEAIKHDKEAFLKVILRWEGCDEKGFNDNLRGTSFAAPTATGVLLAASVMYPDASQAEIIDAFCSACVPITHRQSADGKSTTDDVPYIVDKKKAYAYSPMVGFGEFVIDDKATKEKPDSWHKMLARLEEMQKVRKAMPKTFVDVGSGPDKRTVLLNGQPSFVTLELDKAKEVVTDDVKKQRAAFEKKVTDAFKEVEKAHGITIKDDVYRQVKNHRYREALTTLKMEHGGTLPTMLGGLLPGFSGNIFGLNMLPKEIMPAVGLQSPAMQKAEEAVKEAEKMQQHTYSFTVEDNQDLCCTTAALRLKFKDMQRTDAFVVLESPDGTRIPIIMGSPNDWRGVPTGTEVASTPGFMRKSAAGTWKLHTMQELDLSDTQLVLSGTERNPNLGIIDVRETVLPGIEKKDADWKLIPEKNTLPVIEDPHKHIRDLNGLEQKPALKAPKEVEISPSPRHQFQEYMNRLLNDPDFSELKKKGFIKDGQIEKVSQHQESRVVDPALTKLYAMITSQPDATLEDVLSQGRGFLASALPRKAPEAEPLGMGVAMLDALNQFKAQQGQPLEDPAALPYKAVAQAGSKKKTLSTA